MPEHQKKEQSTFAASNSRSALSTLTYNKQIYQVNNMEGIGKPKGFSFLLHHRLAVKQ